MDPADRGAGTVAGLILAAGESRRMGRPKATLDWGGVPLLHHQVQALREAGCEPVIVVLGAEAHNLRARLREAPPCVVVENAAYRSGRASSLRVGASLVPDDAGAVLVASVDQPCRASTVEALIAAWRTSEALIVVPRHDGRNGHPVLIDSALRAELGAVQEASEGLRAVRAAHREATRFVDVDDPRVTLNLNTPAAYEAARATLAPDASG